MQSWAKDGEETKFQDSNKDQMRKNKIQTGLMRINLCLGIIKIIG